MAFELEPQGEEGTLSLTTPEPGTPANPERSDKDTAAKAERVKYSIRGETSKYIDPTTVHAQLASFSERELARAMAEAEAAEKNTTKRKILEQLASRKAELGGGPLTPKEQDIVLGLSTPELADPRTSLERKFAEAVTNDTLSSKSDTWGAAVGEDDTGANEDADRFQEIVAKGEIGRSIVERADKRAADQTWTEWGIDTAKSLIPLYDRIKINNLVTTPGNPWLEGNTIQAQAEYLYSLPVNEFKKQFEDAYEALAKDNVEKAKDWAQSIVGMTTTTQAFKNFITVTDIADVSGAAVGISKATVKGVATGSLQAGVKSARAKMAGVLRDVAEVATKKELSTADVQAAAGNVVDSATIKATEILDLSKRVSATGAGDAEDVAKLISKTAPSLSDPLRIVDSDVPTRLTNTLAVRLADQADSALEAMKRILFDTHKIARLDEGKSALNQAFDNAMEIIKETYGPSVRNAILDAQTRRVYGSETISNINFLEVAIGKTSGELFDSEEAAFKVIRDFYGVKDESLRIERMGDKYYGVIRKDVDETAPNVRDKIIDTDTKTPINPFGIILNKIRSADGLVSKAQQAVRKTLVNSQEEMIRQYRIMSEPIEALSTRERKRLSRVLEENRDMINPNDGKRGYYYKTVNEFDEAFIKLTGQVPTPKEREAYFAARRLNDFHYLLTNLSLTRNRSLLGWEEWSFNIGGKRTANLHGKFVEDIPWDNTEDARILIVDPDGSRIVSKNQMSANEKSLLKAQLSNKGRTVVQLVQPLRKEIDEFLPENLRSLDPINFVVSAKPIRNPLSMQQIPYREGGHVVNDYQWFVKNGNIVNSPKGKYYAGDNTFSGHVTEREAQELAKTLEEGRQLFIAEKQAGKSANKSALDDFAARNLPMSGNEFRQLFHKGAVNPDGPFVVLKSGARYSDITDLKSQGVRDLTKSSYNMEDFLDKAFTAERGEPLMRFRKGEEGNPVWKMEVGRTLNPLDTLNKSLKDAIKSRLYTDYVTRVSNEWIKQFGDLMAPSEDTLLRNPVYWLYHPQWKDVNKAYSAQGVEQVARTVTKVVPARARKTDYKVAANTGIEDVFDGRKVIGGSTIHKDNPSLDFRWNNVQDGFGTRSYGDTKLQPPEWFAEIDQLTLELSAKLDIPNVKVWFGESAIGTGRGMFYIDYLEGGGTTVNIVLNRNLRREDAVRVLAHEIGHVVDYTALRLASQETQDAVKKAYDNWFIKKFDTTIVNYQRPSTNNSSLATFKDLTKADPNHAAYVSSFVEWWADETARWLLTTKKPMTVVERFFEGIAQGWKEVYNYFAKQMGLKQASTNRQVASFLKGQWREDKEFKQTFFETVFTSPTGSDSTVPRMSAAKAMRDAAINLIETPTPIRVAWDSAKNRILNTIYDRLGDRAADWVDEKAILRTRDPIRFLRSAAFHSSMGIFNPVQFFLNSATLMHAAAISPQHFLPAMRDSMILWYTRMNPSTELYQHLKAKSGYRYFDELHQLIRDSGFHNVGGGSAWLDDALEPKLVQNAFGKFLDAGTIFFRNAEQIVKINAYTIAHREWRKANPDAVVTDAVRQKLIRRADDLSVNMTRASNAWINQGIMSVPTQFSSYSFRMAEQLLEGVFSGKGALTRKEAARAMATYATVFGVPTAGAAALGVVPIGQMFEQWAMENGYDIDSNALAKVFARGLLTTVADVASGESTNINERYGPNGSPLIADLVSGEKGAAEVLMGASGNILMKSLKATVPLAAAVSNIFQPEDNDFPLVASDFLDAARTIATVEAGTKAYLAYNWQIWASKNDSEIVKVEPLTGIYLALLGLSPREALDTYNAKKILANSAKHKDEVGKLVQAEINRYLRAEAEGDTKLAEKYFRRAQIWVAGADLSEADKASLLLSTFSQFGSEAERVNMRMLQKSRTPEELNRRIDRTERLNNGRTPQ